jgi:hypothetical protein
MSDQFFMPLGKEVCLVLMDDNSIAGKFGGFVQFGGIPAVYLYSEYENLKKETLIPINQIITFEVVKPKTLIL